MAVEDGALPIDTLKRRVEQAQRRIRQYIKPGRSLADELITERRSAAKSETEREHASDLETDKRDERP